MKKPKGELAAVRWWWGWSQLSLNLLAKVTIKAVFFSPLPFLFPRTGKFGAPGFLFTLPN